MDHKAPNTADYPKEDSRLNDKTWYPRKTVELINFKKKRLCKKCQLPCNSDHLLEHYIQMPTNKEILQLMEDGTNDLRNTGKSGNKIEILKTLGERLEPYINSIKTILM